VVVCIKGDRPGLGGPELEELPARDITEVVGIVCVREERPAGNPLL